MTCIVGLISNASIHIGVDSTGVAGLSVSVRADRRVLRNQDLIFGFIPAGGDHDRCADPPSPMEMIFHGWSRSLFQPGNNGFTSPSCRRAS